MFKKMFGARSKPHINGLYRYIESCIALLICCASSAQHGADRGAIDADNPLDGVKTFVTGIRVTKLGGKT